jgi:hypothetical protein
MTLPEVCPLDEKQKCKGRECHLFCLEWRTREPTCLIGYSTTSKVKSWKDDRKQDTYAEETYRKLGTKSASRKKSVSEKGDWIPTRLKENPPDKSDQRREVRSIQKPVSQNPVVSNPAARPETDFDRRPHERKSENIDEAEKAFMRLGARLKKEPVAEEPIIYGRNQTKVQEKAKVPEKVISSNKHTTIFMPSDKAEKRESYPLEREEKIKKPSEDKEKRKKIRELR